MKSPIISVVMSVYNGDKYLREAIESILNQTFNNFEFIIVNDGSEDGSLDIIKSYNDSRIVVVDQENTGLAIALNNGIQIAKGRYIARMDADDISDINRLEIQYNFLESNPEIGIVGTWITFIDDNGNEIGKKKEPISPNEINNKILTYGCFNHGTVMFRRDVFFKAGKYSDEYPENPPTEDFALWNRILRISSGANIPQYLYRLRMHPFSISSTQRKDQINQHFLVSKKYIFKRISEHRGENKKLAIYYFKLGDIHYHYRKLVECRKYLIKSILLNPFISIKAYRYFMFSFFSKRFLDNFGRRKILKGENE